MLPSDRQTDSYNNALKILVCYHKPYTMPEDKNIFLPIHCGKALTDLDLHIQTDNLCNGLPCDNISEKNPYYSELTAMYWAWKNIKILYPDIKYIGLMHYRRFFAFDERKFFVEAINKPESYIANYKIDPERIINIIDSDKIIVPSQYIFPYSLRIQYNSCHFSEDLRVLEGIIKNQFSDYYEAFTEVMDGNKLYARNIFIMKYNDFCEYCEWIFAVLDEVDKRINYQTYSLVQRRAPGYMSERLFNVYMHKHGKKLKFFNLYYFDDKYKLLRHKFILFVIDMFGYLRDELTTALLRSNGKFIGMLSRIKRIFKREK